MPRGRAIKSKRQWRALWAKVGRGEISARTVRKMTHESKKYRALAGISIKARCPREGTKVRFNPNPVSLMMYSSSHRLPKVGTIGRVTSIPGFRGRTTCMKGPGGGLVYVDWPSIGTSSASSHDLDKVR